MRLSPQGNFSHRLNQQIRLAWTVLPQTHSVNICLKCQREFYMAKVVFARIRAGARASGVNPFWNPAQGTQGFHDE